MAAYTEEQLKRMPFQQRKNARELMKLEEEMKSVGIDEEQALLDFAAREKSVQLPSEPLITNNPEKLQTPVSTTPEVTPQVTPEVAQEEIKDLEYFKKLAETKAKEAQAAEDRRKEAQRVLTPVQEEASHLRKERSALEDRLNELMNKFDELKSKVDTSKIMPIEDDDPLFSENYPDIDKRIKTAVAKAKADASEAVRRDIEERLKNIEASRKQQEVNEFASKHFSKVVSLCPEAQQYYSSNLFPAVAEWANTQSPIIRRIINNPTDFDPTDVVDVLNRFKSVTAPKTTSRTPSLGDLVTKVTGAPPSITAGHSFVATPTDLMTNEEVNNIDQILKAARKNPTKMSEIMDRFERTMEFRNQPNK
jgi:hypothetical protein